MRIRRVRFRFSLRVLFVVMTLVAISVGYVFYRDREQQRVVRAILDKGGTVVYSHQIDAQGKVDLTREPPVPKWVRSICGERAFLSLQRVVLPDPNNRELATICSQRSLHRLHITGDFAANIDFRALQSLPQLKLLIIDSAGFENKHFIAIPPLPQVNNLQLRSATRVTVEGLKELNKFSGVEVLGLGKQFVDLDLLAHLKALPNLRNVVFVFGEADPEGVWFESGNRHADVISDLKASRPDLRIYAYHPAHPAFQ